MFKNNTMISIEIICIGDELLIGQTVNTNASWMGDFLAQKGYKVSKTTVVSDQEEAIWNAIKLAEENQDVVLITGGLGPTKDDITKQVLCRYFGTRLIENKEVLKHVKAFFEKRNRPMLDVNMLQAQVPENCTVLFNDMGTAPGMLFERKGKTFVSMPGVPYEMKFLMEARVLSVLEAKYPVKKLVQQTIIAQGIGESFLADSIQGIEQDLREEGLELAYLPSPGLVKLRITSQHGEDEKVSHYSNLIYDSLPRHFFFFFYVDLAAVIGELLIKRKETVGTIESCTGGRIAAEIASISGASNYFQGGLITYSNELKKELAFVKEETLRNFGAVSSEVVCEMALGGIERLNTDWSIAVSGIAGPTGGTEEKPVGTVWIAVANKKGVDAHQFLFGNDRGRTIQMTVLTALNLLRCKILEI